MQDSETVCQLSVESYSQLIVLFHGPVAYVVVQSAAVVLMSRKSGM